MKYVRVLDGCGIPFERDLSIVDAISKGKGEIRNCSDYRTVKHLEHGIKVMERVLEKKLRRIVSVDEMQF